MSDDPETVPVTLSGFWLCNVPKSDDPVTVPSIAIDCVGLVAEQTFQSQTFLAVNVPENEVPVSDNVTVAGPLHVTGPQLSPEPVSWTVYVPCQTPDSWARAMDGRRKAGIARARSARFMTSPGNAVIDETLAYAATAISYEIYFWFLEALRAGQGGSLILRSATIPLWSRVHLDRSQKSRLDRRTTS